MTRRIQLRFLSLSAFEREFERNIAHGGATLETDEEFELQEIVEVEVDLAFCGHVLVLEAEIVSHLSAGAADPNAVRGVAVQFTESAHMLRLLLSGMANIDAPPPAPPLPKAIPPRRPHERTATELLATLEYAGRRQTVLVANLSRSGALLDLEGPSIGLGARLTIVFRDPTADSDTPVEAEVVRHEVGSDGRSRIGVEFDLDPASDNTVTRSLDRLLGSSRTQKLGRIVGDLAALGLPSLMQMFSSGAEQGTLLLTRGAREARILFERGTLRHVELGGARGLKALTRLLNWTHGRFEYRPTLADDAPQTSGLPIDAGLLEAMQHMDELERLDLAPFPASATVVRTDTAAPDDLSKTELAVLEHTAEGIAVAALLDTLPAFDDEIYAALATLREHSLISL